MENGIIQLCLIAKLNRGQSLSVCFPFKSEDLQGSNRQLSGTNL